MRLPTLALATLGLLNLVHAEDVARKADPSLGPLFEKMRKAGEGQRGRKQPE